MCIALAGRQEVVDINGGRQNPYKSAEWLTIVSNKFLFTSQCCAPCSQAPQIHLKCTAKSVSLKNVLVTYLYAYLYVCVLVPLATFVAWRFEMSSKLTFPCIQLLLFLCCRNEALAVAIWILAKKFLWTDNKAELAALRTATLKRRRELTMTATASEVKGIEERVFMHA